METEDGRAELRGLYTDPARPLTVAVGQAFDLVSMPTAVGLAALDTLRARRVRLGPVVADSRRSVMRVGFLVPPQRALHDTAGAAHGLLAAAHHALPATPATDEAAQLREWADRLGPALGVRVGGPGTTATLPPLLPWQGWLRWLVPPAAAAGIWTPAGALLAVLAERASRLLIS